MIVIPGPASQDLGRKVADTLKSRTVPVVFKTFPDGESYLRLDGNVTGEEVVIVQTTGPPQDVHIMQLFLMVDVAKDLGAKKVTVVVPYLAYARQDKRFLPGEAISIETFIKLIEASGIDRFLTVNIHEEGVLNKFSVPAENLSAMTLLAEYFKKKGLTGAFSLAPDQGALELVKEADKVLNGGCGWLRKERDRLTGEIGVEEKKFDIRGRDVIVFDDIISTGGTIAAAVKMLKEQGARKVYAACAHPLLVGEAQKKIMQSGAEEIVGTDCVPSPVSVVSVAPLIAEALAERGI
ncbi:MAG: Ribose-phosphate pyrophosphokinase [Candidatus Bathyarchaeota archaeon BA2]|nr:MAG: Ribose-phosphate pyrophosphokinase [Candidatus Bathyarchaeota archaeon BA2]